MTKLTKERLEEIAELARKATYKPCAMHMTNLLVVCDSEVIEEMARQLLASMEQEPVSYTCSDALDDVYCGSAAMMGPAGAVGEVPLYAAPQLPHPAPEHLAAVATLESKGYTWYGGQLWKPPLGKAPAYITDEQPAVPETLPCPVMLEPGLRFGKGVRTQTMLDALQRRDEYYADLEAMTPGQRADHDAGMKEFAAMLQAEPVSNSDELPLDYLQGHKDGLEWAAQLAEANHPQTGDWLYDDQIDLARAIRKGPDMPTVQGGNSPVTPDGWISCSERMPDTKTAVLVAREFDRKGDWRMKWATYIPGHPDANDGWIIPGASWIPSHWMPLPEPPLEAK